LLPSPSSAKDLLAHLPWRAAPGERRRGRRLEPGGAKTQRKSKVQFKNHESFGVEWHRNSLRL